jgi:hypothetical protein
MGTYAYLSLLPYRRILWIISENDGDHLKSKNNLQVEERDIVVDIVKRLTGSEDYIPEEYRNSSN